MLQRWVNRIPELMTFVDIKNRTPEPKPILTEPRTRTVTVFSKVRIPVGEAYGSGNLVGLLICYDEIFLPTTLVSNSINIARTTWKFRIAGMLHSAILFDQ